MSVKYKEADDKLARELKRDRLSAIRRRAAAKSRQTQREFHIPERRYKPRSDTY